MNLYIIILEIDNPSSNEGLIISSVLHSLGKSLKLTEHAYVLSSEVAKASQVRDAFNNAPIDVNRIYVSKCTHVAAWRNILVDNTSLKALLNGED